ncbi:hypothetical protein PMAYCL1PPCAC_32794, partial [Pristionchus mayeri]
LKHAFQEIAYASLGMTHRQLNFYANSIFGCNVHDEMYINSVRMLLTMRLTADSANCPNSSRPSSVLTLIRWLYQRACSARSSSLHSRIEKREYHEHLPSSQHVHAQHSSLYHYRWLIRYHKCATFRTILDFYHCT